MAYYKIMIYYSMSAAVSQPRIPGRRKNLAGLNTFTLANWKKTCYTVRVCWRESPFASIIRKKNSLEVLINA